MRKLPRESKDCVVVRSQHNVGSGNSTYKHGLKACALLFSIFMAWRIAWPLVSMVVVNQGLVCLALLVFVAIVYVPLCCFFYWMVGNPLEGPQKESNPNTELEEHWVITEQAIKRYYGNHFQCWSIKSVKSVSYTHLTLPTIYSV